jgi:hypothetical protein
MSRLPEKKISSWLRKAMIESLVKIQMIQIISQVNELPFQVWFFLLNKRQQQLEGETRKVKPQNSKTSLMTIMLSTCTTWISLGSLSPQSSNSFRIMLSSRRSWESSRSRRTSCHVSLSLRLLLLPSSRMSKDLLPQGVWRRMFQLLPVLMLAWLDHQVGSRGMPLLLRVSPLRLEILIIGV